MELYEKIRNELLQMQKECTGGAIQPYILQNAFEQWLNATKPKSSRTNAVTAFNMARVYCVLCNNYWLINYGQEDTKNTFWVASSRWKKANIKPGMLQSNVKKLKDLGMIRYYNGYTPSRQDQYGCNHYRFRRIYEISLTALNTVRVAMKYFLDKGKHSQVDFWDTNSFWWDTNEKESEKR
ncbi:MAG: hypothetical protein LBM01_02890 [Christensenellaceae bacterium]|jgi:hypothetical protein|nr:hypothetical protein [Christensenellaceae bacterium]